MYIEMLGIVFNDTHTVAWSYNPTRYRYKVVVHHHGDRTPLVRVIRADKRFTARKFYELAHKYVPTAVLNGGNHEHHVHTRKNEAPP